MSGAADQGWDDLWSKVDTLTKAVAKTQSLTVSSERVRSSARAVSLLFLRTTRPLLLADGVPDELLSKFSAVFEALLRLSADENKKSSYTKVCKELSKLRPEVEIARANQNTTASQLPITGVEKQIYQTLQQMLPFAAASYQQALSDLATRTRASYRGTAVELREALREVLDHLAPDVQVKAEPGFKFEKDKTQPTMAQKVRFVLKSRKSTGASISTAEDVLERVEAGTASLMRSVYMQGSVATHVAANWRDAFQLKLYTDSLLMELLALERSE